MGSDSRDRGQPSCRQSITITWFAAIPPNPRNAPDQVWDRDDKLSISLPVLNREVGHHFVLILLIKKLQSPSGS